VLLETTTVLAEVRLIIAPKEMRLVLTHDNDVIEDELWKAPSPISRTEAKQAARAAFDDWYDFMNHCVHGE
jgi:hypothetical protein